MVRRHLKEAAYLAYHMHGGVTFDMVLDMSPTERDVINEVIEEALEYQDELRKQGFGSVM